MSAHEPQPRTFAPFAFGRAAPHLPAASAQPSAAGRATSAAHRGGARAATPSAGGGAGFQTPAGAGGPSGAAPERMRHHSAAAAGALAPAPPLSDDPARVFGALRAHYAALASRNCPALLAALTSYDSYDSAELAAQALRRDALFAAPHAPGAASDDEAAAAAEAAARRRRQQRRSSNDAAAEARASSPHRGAASCDTWPPRGAASPPADAPSPPAQHAREHFQTCAAADDDDELDALFPLAGAAGRGPPAAWRERQQEHGPLYEFGIAPFAWTAADDRSLADAFARGLDSPGGDEDPAARKRHRTQAGAASVGVGALRPRQR